MNSKKSAKPSRKPSVRRGEARERLMQAARILVIAHGMEGVSIRAINAAAGVSPGILHYHFGSLRELVLELLARNMQPLMEQRRAMLQARLGREAFSLRDIADVLVLPLAKLAIDGGDEGIAHVRLLARLYVDRSPLLDEVSVPWMAEINQRQFQELERLNPGVPAAELSLRMDLASHAMLQGLAGLHCAPFLWQVTQGVAALDPWQQVRLVVDFVEAGLRSINRSDG